MNHSKGNHPQITILNGPVAFTGDSAMCDADRRAQSTYLTAMADHAVALPAAPTCRTFTGLQLAGSECAEHGVDPGPDVPLHPQATTLDGDVLQACSPERPCPPPSEALPAGVRLAEDAIRSALGAAARPQEIAVRLLLAVAELAEEVSPHPGQAEWTNAERASNPLYAAVDALLDATVRRHVEGAQADGITPAEAGSDIRTALLASVAIATARHTRTALAVSFGEDEA